MKRLEGTRVGHQQRVETRRKVTGRKGAWGVAQVNGGLALPAKAFPDPRGFFLGEGNPTNVILLTSLPLRLLQRRKGGKESEEIVSEN